MLKCKRNKIYGQQNKFEDGLSFVFCFVILFWMKYQEFGILQYLPVLAC